MKFLEKGLHRGGLHSRRSTACGARPIRRLRSRSFATASGCLFSLRDGKGKLIAPVFGVFGKEMTANIIEVPMTERNGMTVHGYIVKPHAGRANRSMQHFFVNGRYVKSRLIQAAMEEAYRNAIITGKYPSGALFLDLHAVGGRTSTCIRQKPRSNCRRKSRFSRSCILPARMRLPQTTICRIWSTRRRKRLPSRVKIMI